MRVCVHGACVRVCDIYKVKAREWVLGPTAEPGLRTGKGCGKS